MLQNFRDKLQGTLAKVIVALIAVPFALFGIEAFFTGGDTKVAMVNGEEITELELVQAIELQRRRLLNQAGTEFDASSLDDNTLRSPVLENLIGRKLLEQVAADAGLIVPGQIIDAVILADPSFQENEQFSALRYENLLRSGGLSPAMYRRMLGEDLLLQQVTAGLVNSAFVTDAEMQVTARIVQQKRDLRYLLVPVPQDADIPIPTEEQIRARFEENPEEFLSTETVDLAFLELRQDQLSREVDESAIREEYARQRDDFVSGTERHAAHILIETNDQIDDAGARSELAALKTRIEAGEKFGALAAEYSDDIGSAAAGGDLGFSSGDTFPEEFETALAALEVGQVSPPTQTDAGWHLIKLLELSDVEAPSFEELRAEIENQLQMEGSEALFVERAEELADLTFNADDLEQAAKTLGLELQLASGVSRDNGEGLFADPRLRRAAFDSEVVEERLNSQLIELSADHAVVLRVLDHRAARPLEFDEVRGTLAARMLTENQAKAVDEKAATLLTALRAGARVDALAEEHSLEWQVVLAATRTGTGVDREILRKGFQLAPPATGQRDFATASLATGGLAVLEISNVQDGALADLAAPMRTQLREAMAQTRGQSLLTSYQSSLRRTAELELL